MLGISVLAGIIALVFAIVFYVKFFQMAADISRMSRLMEELVKKKKYHLKRKQAQNSRKNLLQLCLLQIQMPRKQRNQHRRIMMYFLKLDG